MKNKISDLRDHLFAVLEALQDKDEPMDLERARTAAQVAQVIVNTATAETKHMQVTGSLQGTGRQRLPAIKGSRGAPRSGRRDCCAAEDEASHRQALAYLQDVLKCRTEPTHIEATPPEPNSHRTDPMTFREQP